MKEVDLLIHARWVHPVDPTGVTHARHSLAITDGKIVDLLPTEHCAAAYQAHQSLTLDRHLLIPGLVNAHTHAGMTLFRGFADDLSLQSWLEDHIWPAEGRFVDRGFVGDGTTLAVAEMLRGGVTCFADMYFFPDEAARAAVAAGIRIVTGMIVIGFPSAWARSTDEYFARGQECHDQYRSHPLVTTCFAPHSPYAVDDRSLARIATLAEEIDVPVQIHVHETASEVADSVSLHGVRPLERLTRLGLVSPRLVAVHMTDLNATDVETVARNGAHVVHCPESNLKLASGFCPVAQLQRAGINVALGTDGAASNNDLDLLSEMRTAALLAKGVADDPLALPAAAALEAATLGGARAYGLDRLIGSLEIGKSADVVAVDLGDFRARPVFDPVSQLVYAGHRDQVSHVWVGGQALVADGHLTTVDEARLAALAEEWADKLRS